MNPRFLLALVLAWLLVGPRALVGGEPPVTGYALEELRAAYPFQPAEVTPMGPAVPSALDRGDEIIKLEKVTVSDSLAQRGLIESVEKLQAEMKQARFNMEKGGFFYRKVGSKFTVATGVWSVGPVLTLATVSW